MCDLIGMTKTNPKINISFFGDSICFGFGVSVNNIWVHRTAARLEQDLLRLGIVPVVQNYSVNGSTTRMALERMPADIQNNDVDILVVQLGINDCSFWAADYGINRVSIEAFEANLAEIVKRGINSGVKKVILNTNHPLPVCEDKVKYGGVSYSESNKRYNEIIRKVAAVKCEYISLADLEMCFLKDNHNSNGEYLLDDLKHLSQKGHDLYYKYFYPVLWESISQITDER